MIENYAASIFYWDIAGNWMILSDHHTGITDNKSNKCPYVISY